MDGRYKRFLLVFDKFGFTVTTQTFSPMPLNTPHMHVCVGACSVRPRQGGVRSHRIRETFSVSLSKSFPPPPFPSFHDPTWGHLARAISALRRVVRSTPRLAIPLDAAVHRARRDPQARSTWLFPLTRRREINVNCFAEPISSRLRVLYNRASSFYLALIRNFIWGDISPGNILTVIEAVGSLL